MARKRLGGPLPDYLEGAATPPAPMAALPIAQVAGDAAAMAALAEVSEELASARAGGRMVLALPIDAIAEDYLIRDRVAQDPEEMAALMQSIAARGQQTPVEVVELGPGRYGLISGARRMTALRRLAEETGEARFGTVLALLRRPEGGADPYVAMVEENEIRVGLSFYERARVVMRAVEAGVYDSEKKALQGLFATASFPKRSKIKSFIPVVEALDGVLRFPARIPERLGLRLSKALGERGFRARAIAALRAAKPATAEAEARVLTGLLRPGTPEEEGPDVIETEPDPAGSGPDLRLTVTDGRVVIEGRAVDADFVAALREWVARR
jgi:ParB family transcriptional regulator, chromosome partitioning protein